MVTLMQNMIRMPWQIIKNMHPLGRGMISYSIMWPTGSLIQQTIEGRNLKTYDWARCMRFSIFGACFVAPNVYAWVRIGGMMWPQTNLRIGITKALLDLFSFAPYMTCNFYFLMSLMEGKNAKQAIEEVKIKFWPTLQMHVQIWPLLNTLNFGLVPEQHRLIVISMCSVLWTAFLAFMKKTEINPKEKDIFDATLSVKLLKSIR